MSARCAAQILLDEDHQDLRAEVQAMGDNERAALEGMAVKSEEFLKGGGKLH